MYPYQHAPSTRHALDDESGGWGDQDDAGIAIDFCDIDQVDGSLPAATFFRDYYAKVRCPATVLRVVQCTTCPPLLTVTTLVPQSRPVIIRGGAESWQLRGWTSDNFLSR